MRPFSPRLIGEIPQRFCWAALLSFPAKFLTQLVERFGRDWGHNVPFLPIPGVKWFCRHQLCCSLHVPVVYDRNPRPLKNFFPASIVQMFVDLEVCPSIPSRISWNWVFSVVWYKKLWRLEIFIFIKFFTSSFQQFLEYPLFLWKTNCRRPRKMC